MITQCPPPPSPPTIPPPLPTIVAMLPSGHQTGHPANILLDNKIHKADDLARAKIGDFGLSRLLGDQEDTHHRSHHSGGRGTGTEGYRDPFQAETMNLQDRLSSDIFSFGVTLMVALTGLPRCVRPVAASSMHAVTTTYLC